MKPAVYTLPHELDTKVAQIKLQSMGYKIDSLSEEQKNIWDLTRREYVNTYQKCSSF